MIHVAGRLDKPSQARVERQVGRVVSRYFDDAFLGGGYPRARFGSSFGTFTPGARQLARHDMGQLTNVGLGSSTESVTPKKKQVLVTAVAPRRVAAGVTARIRLVFVADRGQKGDHRVTVTGRLMLTRVPAGGWQIFGYDVARAAVPTGRGVSR